MDIKNTKELAKIIALCRKNGANSFTDAQSGISFTLGPAPTKQRKEKTPKHNPILDELTEEQKLFWSSAGIEAEAQS